MTLARDAFLPFAATLLLACIALLAAVQPRPASAADTEAELLRQFNAIEAKRPFDSIAQYDLEAAAEKLVAIYRSQSKPESATALLRRAGASALHLNDPVALDLGGSRYHVKGVALSEANQLDAAALELRFALAFVDGAKRPLNTTHAGAANELAVVNVMRGDYAGAAGAFARVAELRERGHGAGHALAVSGWRELAFLQRMAGQQAEARASLARAHGDRGIKARRSAEAADPVTLQTLGLDFLATTHRRVQEHFNLSRRKEPPDDLHLASLMDAMAAISLARGQVQLAERTFDRAQRVRLELAKANPAVLEARRKWFADLMDHHAEEQALIK